MRGTLVALVLVTLWPQPTTAQTKTPSDNTIVIGADVGFLASDNGAPDSAQALQATTGATVDPFAAYLFVRGLKTFALRMERQNTNAQALAECLAAHPRVSAVHYAELPSHPGHDVAKKQMRGFGGGVLRKNPRWTECQRDS